MQSTIFYESKYTIIPKQTEAKENNSQWMNKEGNFGKKETLNR